MTLMLTCSMLGEKMPLFFIGKSKSPRCLKQINLSAMNVFYSSNKTAFMTETISDDYVESLSNIMIKSSRKILLILDNAPQHKPKSTSNITFLLLPPRVSALIQPLDMGIIKSLKGGYKKGLAFTFSLISKMKTQP